MSYPKPLSEKSLNRLYMQAGLSTETCAFLHSLFAACANLYGTIAIRDVWSVYQELKSDVPRIHRRDLIAFSSIVRREVQPYWVYSYAAHRAVSQWKPLVVYLRLETG